MLVLATIEMRSRNINSERTDVDSSKVLSIFLEGRSLALQESQMETIVHSLGGMTKHDRSA